MTTLAYQKPAEIDSRRIKVAAIDIPEEYEGKESLVEDDALRRSIEQSGVQQSVHLLKDGRRCILIDGARRVLISRSLNLDDIPAVVLESEGDPLAYRNKLRFILNQLRQDLLPTQRAALIKQLMDKFGMKQKDVAAYLGVDAGSVSNWLAIEAYVPEIRRAIDTGEITSFHARAFDGLTAEGQRTVWKKKREVLSALSGKVAHQEIRKQFSPEAYPKFYVAPERTLEKLKRKQGKRAARHRPKLSRDDKDKLSRDLHLREVELKDGQKELAQLKREIALAAPCIHAIMRSDNLVALLPDEIGQEFTRFCEVY